MNYTELLIIYVIAWTVFSMITFVFYAFDKRQAKLNKYRIRESTLLTLTLLLGSIGALIGIYGLKHKSKHILFVVVSWTSLILHCLILTYLVVNA